MDGVIFKGKRINDGRWEKGYYVKMCDGKHYIFTGVIDATGLYPTFCRYEIDPTTLRRFTGRYDISGKEIYEGDFFESHQGTQILDILMMVKFGTYEAYCPADDCYMDNVGFYAEAIGYPQMPLGPLENYAKVIGNIFDNPDLLDS